MRKLLENQRDNLFWWVPILLAFGGACYFTMPFEIVTPYVTPVLVVISILVGTAIIFAKMPVIIRAGLIFIFGFIYAAMFTGIINTPQLKRDLHNLTLDAVVENIEHTDNRTRLLLRINANDINSEYSGTANIRVTINTDTDVSPRIGDVVRITGGLFRPSAAYAPAAFDYARWAYFNNLSATGYANNIEIIQPRNQTGINTLRDDIRRVANSELVDSLVLGYKNAIPKTDKEIWVATGIGHVWSISGFHMALVGGWLYAIFWAIMRLIAPITRRVPARISATVLAWVGLAFYLCISGIGVATVRAFLMTTLIFVAVAMGRNAISMRNIALVFCAVFFINPHYVMQAGFQLSFAAVFGLIWFWNIVCPKLPSNKIAKVCITAILTAVVATIFTAPFVIAHFYAMPIYGLIGNLVLLPIFSILIMPLVIVGTITAFVGIHIPLDIANIVYNWTLAIAGRIASMPHAMINMPHISNLCLGTIIIGMCAVMFIKPIKFKINYIAGSMAVMIGILIAVLQPTPVFMATPDHELVAFVNDGKITFNKSRASNHFFAFDTWKQLCNIPTNTNNERHAHNNGVYRFATDKFNLVYIQRFVPLQKNIVSLCNDTDVDFIVSYFDINAPKCAHKILRGGIIIYPSGRIEHIYQNRRWHNAH